MTNATLDFSYADDPDYRIAAGPFEPTWESLQQFTCPDWFRDAKLGFWAHWGPQAQPLYGDWYARNMYIEGSDQYRFHLRTYGHPSKVGWKDICRQWKAEAFDADALMKLYKEAGARYFTASDLIEHYEPDLLYTDGSVPFGEVGRRLIAHLYNLGAARHGGRPEAIYTLKHFSDQHGLNHGEYRDGIGVLDMERGVVPDIREQPWQTDTCIGGWFYDRRKAYKSAADVIHLLVDIVSKNGNLLLNFPLRGDGTLDDESRHVLQGIGRWMAVHGAAIYGTRPWTTFGEGPTRSGGGQFNEAAQPWTAEDFRFVRSGDTVYAFQMAWPGNREALIKTLKLAEEVRVKEVRLIGYAGLIPWSQTVHGLQIGLPAAAPGEAVHAFAIQLF